LAREADDQALRAYSREHSMASKTNPVTFIKQVQTETSKVTWPSRRETMISTAMVLVMVAFASIFFFLADFVFGYAMSVIQGASI
jgi:preprotein translocase subunit SecE